MHVVVIGFVWPEPRSSAAGQNMLNLLKCLKQHGWQVTFCCAAKHSEFEVSLEDLQIKTHEIELNCSSFNSFMTSIAPDIVVFDRFMIEEQFGSRVIDSCPNALRVLNTEDLHSLRNARQQALKSGNNTNINNEISYREIASILRCDLTLLVSNVELNLLKSEFNIDNELLHHWPLMPEQNNSQMSQSEPQTFESRNGFVFIGNYRHAPNWDAVLWLRQSIWPKIRAQLPTATLSIYGAYQPPKATQLHAPKIGFLVKGRASTAEQVMREAKICLAPLRFGAGIKGKLLDAIAADTPSVTTTVGIEGIEAASTWPGIVADDADQIAAAAVTLHQNKELWEKASHHCAELSNSLFARSTQYDDLIAALKHAVSDISNRRKRNFMGALLQHHSMASTRYMTQWIEAKNNK